jgi:ATP-binding cassette, subfamily B, bacterial MsbA
VASGDVRLIGEVIRRGLPHKWQIALSLAGHAITGAMLAYLLAQLGPFIKYLGLSMSGAETNSADVATNNLTALGLNFLALAPLAAAGAFIGWLMGQWVANRTMEKLRSEVLNHLVHLDLSYHHSLSRGDMLTRLTADLNSALFIMQQMYGKLTRIPLETVGILGFVTYYDWRLALALIIILFPLVMFLLPLIRRTRTRSNRARETLAENFSVLEQITAGIKVIKAMGSSEREAQRYANHNRSLFNDNMRVARARAQSDALTAAAIFAIVGIALIAGGWLFSRQLLQPDLLFLGVGALARMITSTRDFVRTFGDLQEHLPAMARVQVVLDQRSAIQDKPTAIPCPVPQQAIMIDNVWFRYQTNLDPVLRGVSIKVPVGKTVALVGQSGAGKSTLLDLLPRFHDVNEGKITIDGVDLRDFHLESLSHHFAIVQQDSFLFNDTVYANISYGRPTATREEIEQAAQRAHIHDAILALDGGLGYNTIVGDRGSRLSGGQRQRVAIARAFLRDAPILLMDEPTSALDADSERHVQEALAALMRGRTVVVVAHRLATVQHADIIYVLAGARNRDGHDDPRRGTVIESGSHHDLITKGGEYAELVRLQQLSG